MRVRVARSRPPSPSSCPCGRARRILCPNAATLGRQAARSVTTQRQAVPTPRHILFGETEIARVVRHESIVRLHSISRSSACAAYRVPAAPAPQLSSSCRGGRGSSTLRQNYQSLAEEEETRRGEQRRQEKESLLATESGGPLASVVVAPHGAHDVVSSGVLVCLGLCGGHWHGRLRMDVRTHARLHHSLMPRCGARPPACGLRLRRSVRVCGVVACAGGGSDWRCRKRQVGGLASASSARRASGRC